MATVLNVIQEVFDEDLGPGLISKVEEVEPRRLDRFRERYQEFTKGFRLPEKPRGHLRPYVTFKALWRTRTRHAFPLLYEDFETPELAAMQEDAIKQQLIYCHSLVIHDPLPYLLDYFSPSTGPQIARRRMRNFLEFLNYVRPLVEREALFFCDEDAYMRDYWSRTPHSPWPPEIVSYEDAKAIASQTDFMSDFGVTPDPGAALALTDEALQSISTTMVASGFHGRNLDMYLPARFYRATLRMVLNKSREVLAIPERELLLLERLLSVKVPNLADLNVEDIVRIRQDEEAFASWRRAISRALERLDALGKDLLEPNHEAVRLIHEELEQVEASLGEDAKRSGPLAALKKGVRSFTIEAIAAGSLSYWFDAKAVVAGAIGKVCLDLLFSYFGRPTSKEALLNHIVLFGSPEQEE